MNQNDCPSVTKKLQVPHDIVWLWLLSVVWVTSVKSSNAVPLDPGNEWDMFSILLFLLNGILVNYAMNRTILIPGREEKYCEKSVVKYY